MFPEELNRFDRTLAILVLLQSRKLVKAQQIADRFGVSLRTIYRDIRSLEAAGVPIIGEAGSGYSIMDGYRLPPVMFTREEASSFVAAEKLVGRFTDTGMRTHFERAMNKIRAVLKGQDKEWISALDAQVWVRSGRSLFNDDVPNALELLFNSIALQQQVHVVYRSQGASEAVARYLEPVGVFHEQEQWYLFAFCHLRNEYRQFRTDRILGIQSTERPFSQKHGNISDQLGRRDQCASVEVVIAVSKETLSYIDSGKNYYGFVGQTEKGDEVELVFRTDSSMEGLARWYLMFGDHARIIGPEAFRQKVGELAEKISVNLQR